MRNNTFIVNLVLMGVLVIGLVWFLGDRSYDPITANPLPPGDAVTPTHVKTLPLPSINQAAPTMHASTYSVSVPESVVAAKLFDIVKASTISNHSSYHPFAQSAQAIRLDTIKINTLPVGALLSLPLDGVPLMRVIARQDRGSRGVKLSFVFEQSDQSLFQGFMVIQGDNAYGAFVSPKGTYEFEVAQTLGWLVDIGSINLQDQEVFISSN
ncbi:MAG: hypothetical protein OXE99_04665 [Cellvibrionales bacterium]|nr:hypothetical protein [Cellvibrionales bacterium]